MIRSSGFTTIEVLIGLAAALVIALFLLQVNSAFIRSYDLEDDLSKLQQDLAAASQVLQQDARKAGYVDDISSTLNSTTYTKVADYWTDVATLYSAATPPYTALASAFSDGSSLSVLYRENGDILKSVYSVSNGSLVIEKFNISQATTQGSEPIIDGVSGFSVSLDGTSHTITVSLSIARGTLSATQSMSFTPWCGSPCQNW